MNTKSLLMVVLALTFLVPAAMAEDPAAKPEKKDDSGPPLRKDRGEVWVEVSEASAEAVAELLEKHRRAVAAKAADPLIAVLTDLLAYNNERFRDAAVKAMKYKATSTDKKAVYAMARERGITKPKRIKALIAGKEESVQVLAARLLANFPGKATNKLLHKTFSNKKVRDDKPRLTKEVIISMGRLGYTKAWADIESEFKKFKDPGIMRGAVLYFGLTKEKRVAKMLCGHIDEPAPGNVNSPSNPPASYWKKRWDAWDNMKDVVQWALKEITGYEGEFHSSKQARDYIRDHKRQLGIR